MFESRELTFANDCFKHERNEEIGVLYQALDKNRVKELTLYEICQFIWGIFFDVK